MALTAVGFYTSLLLEKVNLTWIKNGLPTRDVVKQGTQIKIQSLLIWDKRVNNTDDR